MINLDELEAGLGCLIPKSGVSMPSCHEKTVCDCTVLKLIEAMRVYREALLKSRNRLSFYCQEEDPIMDYEAKAITTHIEEILGGEIASKQLKQVPDGELFMTDFGPILSTINAEAFQALRPGDRVGFKLGKIK